MTTKMKRRQFIKLAGMGAGAFMTGASGSTAWNMFDESTKDLLKIWYICSDTYLL